MTSVGRSTIKEEIPVDGSLRRLLRAAEHALPRLARLALGGAGADVPHTERDGAGGEDDKLVGAVLEVVEVTVIVSTPETDALHDVVGEAGGEREARTARGAYAAVEVRGQPDRHVRRLGLHFEVKGCVCGRLARLGGR
jgi:hypothetical protein